MPEPFFDGIEATTRHSSQNPKLSQDIPVEPPAFSCDAAVLVPRITVTPEVKAVEGNRGSMWVAIEASAELSRPSNGSLADASTAIDVVKLGGDETPGK